jgi:hypothetical protein
MDGGVFAAAKSAVHEIAALILLLMSAIFFSSLALINTLDKFQSHLFQQMQSGDQSADLRAYA